MSFSQRRRCKAKSPASFIMASLRRLTVAGKLRSSVMCHFCRACGYRKGIASHRSTWRGGATHCAGVDKLASCDIRSASTHGQCTACDDALNMRKHALCECALTFSENRLQPVPIVMSGRKVCWMSFSRLPVAACLSLAC